MLRLRDLSVGVFPMSKNRKAVKKLASFHELGNVLDDKPDEFFEKKANPLPRLTLKDPPKSPLLRECTDEDVKTVWQRAFGWFK
jgi:hypothetical protein